MPNSLKHPLALPASGGFVTFIFAALGGASFLVALATGILAGIGLHMILRIKRPGNGSGDALEPADIAAIQAGMVADVERFHKEAGELANSESRELATRIGVHFDRIVPLLAAPDRGEATQLVSGELISPALATLTEYTYMSRRDVPQVRDIAKRIEQQDLPAIEYGARATVAVLDRPGSVDITALQRALGFNLGSSATNQLGGPETWGNRAKIVAEAGRDKGEGSGR